MAACVAEPPGDGIRQQRVALDESALVRQYDAEVRFMDSQLARVLKRLRALDLYEQTSVAIVGDHGESLGEHGEATHGVFLYQSTLRVPLLIHGPASRPGGRTVGDAVSLADLAPTLLELAGVEVSATMRDAVSEDLEEELDAKIAAVRAEYDAKIAKLTTQYPLLIARRMAEGLLKGDADSTVSQLLEKAENWDGPTFETPDISVSATPAAAPAAAEAAVVASTAAEASPPLINALLEICCPIQPPFSG